MINYENIAKQTKKVKNSQIVTIGILLYGMFIASFQVLLPVFISYSPKHRLVCFYKKLKCFFTIYFLKCIGSLESLVFVTTHEHNKCKSIKLNKKLK